MLGQEAQWYPQPCPGPARSCFLEHHPPPHHSGHPPHRSPCQTYWRLGGCEGGNATAFLGPWGARWAGNGGPLWAGACKERGSHCGTIRVRGWQLGPRPWRFSHQSLLGQGKGSLLKKGGGWEGRKEENEKGHLRQEQAEGLLLGSSGG